jgi:hypothetical protein
VALQVKLVQAARVKHVPTLETWDGDGSALWLGIGGDDVDGRCADDRLMKSRSPPVGVLDRQPTKGSTRSR